MFIGASAPSPKSQERDHHIDNIVCGPLEHLQAGTHHSEAGREVQAEPGLTESFLLRGRGEAERGSEDSSRHPGEWSRGSLRASGVDIGSWEQQCGQLKLFSFPGDTYLAFRGGTHSCGFSDVLDQNPMFESKCLDELGSLQCWVGHLDSLG